MKGNRNKQTTKYGKKETMEGQESSMSLASGMHCLGLPFAGTCSLLLSLNKQCSKSAAQTAGTTKRAKSIDPYAAERVGQGSSTPPSSPHLGRACTSLHPLRYDERDKVARKSGLHGTNATAQLCRIRKEVHSKTNLQYPATSCQTADGLRVERR